MSRSHQPGEAADLRSLQLAFLDAVERGESPAPWLAAYPEHAAMLAALAGIGLGPTAPAPAEEVAAAAAILHSTLQAHLTAADPPEPGLAARCTNQGLALAAVAAQVRLPVEILFKIDRRIIPLDTVPARLLAELAVLLNCPVAALCAGLAGGAPQTAGVLYHAARPPTVGQQPFEEAVRASVNITPADRGYWLAGDAQPAASCNPPA